VWNLLFSTIGAPEVVLENRFLDLMAFSEGYHRALRDDPPLSKAQHAPGVMQSRRPWRTRIPRFATSSSHDSRMPIARHSATGSSSWQAKRRPFSGSLGF